MVSTIHKESPLLSIGHAIIIGIRKLIKLNGVKTEPLMPVV